MADLQQCQNEYCEATLDRHEVTMEKIVSGYDEDKGNVEDIYEILDCKECGYENQWHLGDRPGRGW